MRTTIQNIGTYGVPLYKTSDTDFVVEVKLLLHGNWCCSCLQRPKLKHIICSEHEIVFIRMRNFVIDPVNKTVGFRCGYDKNSIHVLDPSLIELIQMVDKEKIIK
jgi:hypothetical protein